MLFSGLLFHEILVQSLIIIHPALLVTESGLSHICHHCQKGSKLSIRNHGTWIIVCYLFAHLSLLYITAFYIYIYQALLLKRIIWENSISKGKEWKILLQTKIERKDNGIKSERICVNVEMATLYLSHDKWAI